MASVRSSFATRNSPYLNRQDAKAEQSKTHHRDAEEWRRKYLCRRCQSSIGPADARSPNQPIKYASQLFSSFSLRLCGKCASPSWRFGDSAVNPTRASNGNWIGIQFAEQSIPRAVLELDVAR